MLKYQAAAFAALVDSRSPALRQRSVGADADRTTPKRGECS